MLMVRGPTLTLVEEPFSEDKQKKITCKAKVCKDTASVNDFALKMMEALHII